MMNRLFQRWLSWSDAERRIIYFANPEQQENEEVAKQKTSEKADVPLDAQNLEVNINEQGGKHLNQADDVTAHQGAAKERTNAEIRAVDPDAVPSAPPTEIGNLVPVRKETERQQILGISEKTASQLAEYKAATDRAFRVYNERTNPETKGTFQTALNAERSIIESHRGEWNTGDDSLKEREVGNRLARLNEIENYSPEERKKTLNFRENKRQEIYQQETAYGEQLQAALSNKQYPLTPRLQSFVSNALDRLQATQEARVAAESPAAKQNADTKEAYEAAEESAQSVEKGFIKSNYAIWQGTQLEPLMRERYGQALNNRFGGATNEATEYNRDLVRVKPDLTDEQQLGDWLDFQDKVSKNPPGSTKEEIRNRDKTRRLLLSNLSENNREQFVRERAFGSTSMPTLTQEQFDKKHFNANLFPSRPNSNSEPIQSEPSSPEPVLTDGPLNIKRPNAIGAGVLAQQVDVDAPADAFEPEHVQPQPFDFEEDQNDLPADAETAIPDTPADAESAIPSVGEEQPADASTVVERSNAALPENDTELENKEDTDDQNESMSKEEMERIYQELRGQVIVLNQSLTISKGADLLSDESVKALDKINQIYRTANPERYPQEAEKLVQLLNGYIQQQNPEYELTSESGNLLIKKTQEESSAETDLGDPEKFKNLTPEQQDEKIANAMLKHGVSVKKTERGYEITRPDPKSNWDVALNKIGGALQLLMIKLGPLFKKFKEFSDMFKGKTPEDAKAEDEKKASDKAKERVQQKIDKEGKKPEDIRKEANDRIAEADTQLIEGGKKSNVVKSNLKDRQTDLENMKKSFESETNAEEQTFIQKKINVIQQDIDKLTKESEAINQEMKTAVQSKKEAAADIVALDTLKKEKEISKVNNIPKNGLWNSADKVKDGLAGWEYKIAKNGSAFARNGEKLQMFDGEKWRDAAESAGIKDENVAAMFRATIVNNGDTTFVDIGPTGETGWKYALDGNTLVAQIDKDYKQYNTSLTKPAWENRGEFKPA